MSIPEPFPRKIWKEIKAYPGNNKCCDCDSLDTDWASISHGTLICLRCAGKHRSLGVNISFVRSIKMDSWSKDQVEMIKQGGNEQIKRFFRKFDLTSFDISTLYCSKPAKFYRAKLKERVEKILNGEIKSESRIIPLSSLKKSKKSFSDLEVDFFTIQFEEGSMGMIVTKDFKNRAVVSKTIDNGQAQTKGVLVGDILSGVSGITISNYYEIMKAITDSARPISILFSRIFAKKNSIENEFPKISLSRSDINLTSKNDAYIEQHPSSNSEYPQIPSDTTLITDSSSNEIVQSLFKPYSRSSTAPIASSLDSKISIHNFHHHNSSNQKFERIINTSISRSENNSPLSCEKILRPKLSSNSFEDLNVVSFKDEEAFDRVFNEFLTNDLESGIEDKADKDSFRQFRKSINEPLVFSKLSSSSLLGDHFNVNDRLIVSLSTSAADEEGSDEKMTQGKVVRVNEDNTYEILYDDGNNESRVPIRRLKSFHELDFEKQPSSSNLIDDVGSIDRISEGSKDSDDSSSIDKKLPKFSNLDFYEISPDPVSIKLKSIIHENSSFTIDFFADLSFEFEYFLNGNKFIEVKSVFPNSKSYKNGLLPGDIIAKINNQFLPNLEQVQNAFNRIDGAVKITFSRIKEKKPIVESVLSTSEEKYCNRDISKDFNPKNSVHKKTSISSSSSSSCVSVSANSSNNSFRGGWSGNINTFERKKSNLLKGSNSAKFFNSVRYLNKELDEKNEVEIIFDEANLGFDLAERISMAVESVVTNIQEGSFAHRSGLRNGYVVIGINYESYISHTHTLEILKYVKRPVRIRFQKKSI